MSPTKLDETQAVAELGDFLESSLFELVPVVVEAFDAVVLEDDPVVAASCEDELDVDVGFAELGPVEFAALGPVEFAALGPVGTVPPVVGVEPKNDWISSSENEV